MTAKEYLQQYLQAEHSINSKLEQVARLRSLAVKTTQSIVDCQVKGTPKNRMENIIAKIVDLESEIGDEIYKLYHKRLEIERIIDSIENEACKQVLRYRYINGWNFEEIATIMNYSIRQIYYLHSNGLKKLKHCIELQ